MRRFAILLALAAAPVLAKTDKPVPVCPEPIKPVLFVSPMGEPFRPKEGEKEEPAKRWFDQADRNKDGSLTVGEMMLDADRFFAKLDKDGNGELLPDEVHAYEEDVLPEVRLYPRRVERPASEKEEERPKPQKKPKKNAPNPFDGVVGAGRYSFLNIPNPVASADDDINRAVSQREFSAAAAERFRDLDTAQSKALMFAQLPKTPAQLAANLACLERVQDAREKRK